MISIEESAERLNSEYDNEVLEELYAISGRNYIGSPPDKLEHAIFSCIITKNDDLLSRSLFILGLVFEPSKDRYDLLAHIFLSRKWPDLEISFIVMDSICRISNACGILISDLLVNHVSNIDIIPDKRCSAFMAFAKNHISYSEYVESTLPPF